ncbi:MAG TPA: nuclear transport factor 2 family protein [Planctomycetota bacterium]|nr:nuclear transport factor 2 family protein [Planctomycetota bacterium]
MKRAAVALLILLGACSKESPMPLDIAQNKQMIWEVIKAYHDASDKGDLDVIQTLLTPDASIVMGTEDVTRGKDNVLRALRDQMKTWDGKGRSTITGKEVIKPDGNIALVTYVASVGNQRGIITAICSRNKDNKWLIAHIHDTLSITTPKK